MDDSLQTAWAAAVMSVSTWLGVLPYNDTRTNVGPSRDTRTLVEAAMR